MEEFNLLLLFICIILFSVFCLLLLKFSLTIPQILSCLLLMEMVQLIFITHLFILHLFTSWGVLMQMQCSWRDVTLTVTHFQKSNLLFGVKCLVTFLTTERRLLWLLQDEKKDAFCTEIYFWKYTRILYLTRCACLKYFNLHTCIKFSKFFTV